MEASDRDQLIRHARALSGLCPAPPPFADWRRVSDPLRQFRGGFAAVRGYAGRGGFGIMVTEKRISWDL